MKPLAQGINPERWARGQICIFCGRDLPQVMEGSHGVCKDCIKAHTPSGRKAKRIQQFQSTAMNRYLELLQPGEGNVVRSIDQLIMATFNLEVGQTVILEWVSQGDTPTAAMVIEWISYEDESGKMRSYDVGEFEDSLKRTSNTLFIISRIG